MKKRFLFLGILALAGCSSVVVKEPFPASTLTEEQRTSLEGTWLLDQEVVHIGFAEDGAAWLAFIEWKDNAFQLKQYRLVFSERNGSLYASLPAEPGATNRYIFAEIKANGPQIVVWIPDIGFVEKQLGGATLKGVVEKSPATQIVLENPAAEVLDFFATTPGAFDYKNPLLFRRLE